MNEQTQRFIYEYDNFEFTLFIPDYWSKVYKGVPRRKLYPDYQIMLSVVRKVPKNRVIIDVGANHGIFAVPACMLGYKVVAFEPVVSNFNNLYQAREQNHLATFYLFNLALSDKTEQKEIFIPECRDNASLSAIAAVANMSEKNYDTEIVQAVSFDSWIELYPEFADVGLIKIDAQGAEYSIIEGMQRFLKEATDISLIIEYENHLNTMGHSFEQLDKLISSLGFTDCGKITGGDKLWNKK